MDEEDTIDVFQQQMGAWYVCQRFYRPTSTQLEKQRQRRLILLQPFSLELSTPGRLGCSGEATPTVITAPATTGSLRLAEELSENNSANRMAETVIPKHHQGAAGLEASSPPLAEEPSCPFVHLSEAQQHNRHLKPRLPTDVAVSNGSPLRGCLTGGD
ncbi:hypothetical protein GH733_009430 [Mirounga leonina]|nr:hypothetical protein GH733_009430 [Mirounga leonina]